MIVVIADDLTGAGEIGGIGLGYGLKTELQRQFYPKTDADLLILDTDSRSLTPQKAGQVIRQVAGRLIQSGLPVEWIYKKTDSVLRGPVASELDALRDEMRAAGVLLVPANPSKGRIIRNGHYFINEKPLNETEFADDPEHPATTSEVLKLPSLSGSGPIRLLQSNQPVVCEGIILGQTQTTNDLLQWAEHIDERTIPAGGGEFFEAILRNKGLLRKTAAPKKEFCFEHKTLLVCGSGSDSSRQALRKAEAFGVEVCRMPEELFKSDQHQNNFLEQWCSRITDCLENSRCVIMAIDRPVVGNAEFAFRLRNIMANAVWTICRKISLNELFVEGGATASEIVGRFGWNRFEPCDQLGPGAVRMKVLEGDNMYLTIKPGSYPWPEAIWNFLSKGLNRAQ